ncbi:GDP-mannose 4,6-dehydratase [Williamsia sp. CHRR-6]|uniref:GDP-mannose 4,6-dehydratase n=1 Tax=Williamsia sp. CHRR-6 TaxID=2835871 RepID=UPI001BDA6D27|nr:GDP-mannose 4,6-dehydratase [Williamsia sp. CHRR-6]MBT0565928.1 GDP-mannose 4,6-dehydratase [Williamsia sp. CHRR-6]
MTTGHGPALITGGAGQDGTLLLAQLVASGQPCVATIAPGTPAESLTRSPLVTWVTVDLTDTEACAQLVAQHRPSRIFHLAALSSVGQSWSDPVETTRVNALATVALLQSAATYSAQADPIRVVVASSAEIFAGTDRVPQNEQTPLCPTNPYGATKVFTHTMTQALRASGLWASNAILYNHESPLRPKAFVTRTISSGVAAIAAGVSDHLALRSLGSRRDWGWAPDYVDALVRIADHDRPDDFVIATGVSHSVGDFVAAAFEVIGITDPTPYLSVGDQMARPTDAAELVGDASKAERELRWTPTASFTDIVKAMVEHDIAEIRHKSTSHADHEVTP